jgi:hypothetical protein
LRDSGNFYELYVAKKVKNNIPQEIVGEDTEEVELDNGEKSSNYIKNRERQAVKDMFNLFSLDEKTAELEALLDFFKQIDTLSVNDDLNALHELIKYNVYVKKYISSE